MFKLYEGPSMLDGQPIGHYLTGIEQPSRNIKTGPMLQTWILRTDVCPLEAVSSGADASICGNCPLRGENGKGRSCYVSVFRAPTQVFNHRHKAKELNHAILAKRTVRFGAYGDPAAVPAGAIAEIAKHAASFTGYTHQWRTCDQDLKRYLMASCDSTADYELAKAAGWRTFRIKLPEERKMATERVCPASEEAGNVLNCRYCGRCNGTTGRGGDVVINVHGNGKKAFTFLPEQA